MNWKFKNKNQFIVKGIHLGAASKLKILLIRTSIYVERLHTVCMFCWFRNTFEKRRLEGALNRVPSGFYRKGKFVSFSPKAMAVSILFNCNEFKLDTFITF